MHHHNLCRKNRHQCRFQHIFRPWINQMKLLHWLFFISWPGVTVLLSRSG